ncbi:VCBS repeat-containing protein [Sorangium sp. So ce1504]|uniref:FG-GAP repeat domain-containing protein n=1 Tax=Sorangium sp. So ce1504 TaxID=3133337 RepID=UPI003F637D70
MSMRARPGFRRYVRAIGGAAALLVAAAGSAGCVELGEISPGVCGNGVIEPSRNEDCDCFEAREPCEVKTQDAQGATSTTWCNPRGSENECRFVCNDVDLMCPSGWGCGVDGVCRVSTGNFKPLGAALPLGAQRLITGDLDGDGRGDLVGVGSTSLEALYFDANSTVGTQVSIPSAGDTPALARLTDDETTDIALSVGPGVAILSGEPGRTFAPVPVLASVFRLGLLLGAASETTTLRGARLLPVGSTREDGQTWVALVVGTDTRGAAPEDVIAVVQGAESGRLSFIDRQRGLRDVAGPLASAELGGGPLHEVVVALADDSAVHIYSPDDGAHTAVELPAGARIAGAAFLRDVSGDGVLDLLVGATCAQPDPRLPAGAPCYELDVAEGAGGGAFGGMAPYGDLSYPAGDMSSGRLPGFGAPVAIGDLNGDGVIDIVDPDAVRLGNARPSPPYQVEFDRLAPANGRRWTSAVIADLTGNGAPDVVVGSADATDLTFFNGVPGAQASDFKLNELKIPTLGNVSSFVVGDFDGDLLPDLSFAESAGSSLSSAEHPTLAVCFGRYMKAPEPPVRLGAFEGLLDIAAVRLPEPDDAVDDISVLFSHGGDVAFSLIEGSSSRSLLPPLPLVRSGDVRQAGELRAVRSIAGRFGGDRAEVASLTIAPPSPGSSRGSAELWLLPAVDSGAIAMVDEAKHRVSLPAELVPSREPAWALDGVAVDLDGDGTDELVLSLPIEVEEEDAAAEPGTPALAGAVTLVRRGASGAFEAPEAAFSPAPHTLYGGLRAGDMDGDGHADVVGVAYELAPGTRTITASRLAVFWNTGEGALDAPIELEVPDPSLEDLASEVTSADFARVDDGMGRSLVVLTRSAAYALDVCGDGAAGCHDLGQHQLRKLDGIPGGSAIATCDVLGDGVDDLAVLSDGALRVHEGVPNRR